MKLVYIENVDVNFTILKVYSKGTSLALVDRFLNGIETLKQNNEVARTYKSSFTRFVDDSTIIYCLYLLHAERSRLVCICITYLVYENQPFELPNTIEQIARTFMITLFFSELINLEDTPLLCKHLCISELHI